MKQHKSTWTDYGKMKLKTTKTYERRLKKFIKSHPEMRRQYLNTLSLLELNPTHPSLRLHKLQGALKSYHSVSINIKYRIVLHLIIREDEIILIDIGSYDYLYG